MQTRHINTAFTNSNYAILFIKPNIMQYCIFIVIYYKSALYTELYFISLYLIVKAFESSL